jgi:hypothetical protein
MCNDVKHVKNWKNKNYNYKIKYSCIKIVTKYDIYTIQQ